MALAYAHCGRMADAAALLDECERDRVWEPLSMHWARLMIRPGSGRLLIGDIARARVLADEGLAPAQSIGALGREAEAMELLARIALARGREGRAEPRRRPAAGGARRSCGVASPARSPPADSR